MLCAFYASSARPIPELLKQIGKKKIRATLLEPSAVQSSVQLEAACELARRSTEEGRAISPRIEMEFLLWLAQSVHVSKAIRLAGAQKNSDFILVLLDCKNLGEAKKTARTLGIRILASRRLPCASLDGQKLVLEQMALSRVREA